MATNIVFYNLDNLYDTLDDPNTDDDEYTPAGSKRWTPDKYRKKLSNLADVIASIAEMKGGFPAVIGVAEIENDTVLNDLVSQRRIADVGYKFVHYESNDARGVDVAFLYRPALFELMESAPVKPVLRSGREYIGRDMLYVRGLLKGEMFCFYVCHFLSRRKGVGVSDGFRRAGAETVYNHSREIVKKYPGIKIIVMGDMNDRPCDASLTEKLRAKKKISEVGENDFYNPFWDLMDAGQGSSLHYRKWTLYDNIIVSRNLVRDCKGLKLTQMEDKHNAIIFRRKFMLRRAFPFGTYRGYKFIGGYSDHLPIVIRLED